MGPAVDVVVATYNRHKQLRRCLDGLASQSVLPDHVIVVDDHSSPAVETGLIASAYPWPLCVVSSRTNRGPAAARNTAVGLSRAELVLFVDDDVVPSARLVEEHLRRWSAKHPQTVVIGPLLPPADWHGAPWTRWEAETIGAEYQRMMQGDYEPTWRQFFTGNALVPRRLIQDAGGFDVSFRRAEDIELGYRMAKLGARYAFEPLAIGWHYAHRSLASWRCIPRQYADADWAIDRLHPEVCWLECIDGESRGRHPLTRIVASILGTLHGERTGASIAISLARALSRSSPRPAASSLLSLAFQLEYLGERRLLKASSATQ